MQLQQRHNVVDWPTPETAFRGDTEVSYKVVCSPYPAPGAFQTVAKVQEPQVHTHVLRPPKCAQGLEIIKVIARLGDGQM